LTRREELSLMIMLGSVIQAIPILQVFLKSDEVASARTRYPAQPGVSLASDYNYEKAIDMELGFVASDYSICT
jgi:hypothetical protein